MSDILLPVFTIHIGFFGWLIPDVMRAGACHGEAPQMDASREGLRSWSERD